MFEHRVSFNDPHWATAFPLLFTEQGVVVITDVFTAEECDGWMDGIVSAFGRLSPGLDRRAAATWTRANLPPQTRVGLYQAAVANLAPLWQIRTDPRVSRIYEVLYSALKGRPITDFVVSGDGLNLKPNGVGPYGATKDWPHLDQTWGQPFRCVQGQAVLTNTTASLRASPKSHQAFGRILTATGGTSKDDWRKFSDEEVATVRPLVEAAGGRWQVPILAPRGSFVVWASSVVHSARYQEGPEPADPRDPRRGWRGAVYICMRPRGEFTEAALQKRRKAFEDNRVTNHWGTKVFPANPNARYGPAPAALTAPDGRNYVTQPAAVYDTLGRPELAAGRARRLAGYDDLAPPGAAAAAAAAALATETGDAAPLPLTDAEIDSLIADMSDSEVEGLIAEGEALLAQATAAFAKAARRPAKNNTPDADPMEVVDPSE